MLQARYDIDGETQSPENEFYIKRYADFASTDLIFETIGDMIKENPRRKNPPKKWRN